MDVSIDERIFKTESVRNTWSIKVKSMLPRPSGRGIEYGC